MSKQELIKIGILSAATIVPRFVEGVRKSEGAIVVAIAARNRDKATKMAQDIGIEEVYSSYESLCDEAEVDLIYIPAYNRAHFKLAKLALETKHHVLLEKPFTLTLAEAKELFELAKTKGKFLMEAQKAVFLPLTQKIKKLIQEDKIIGNIEHVQVTTSYLNAHERISWFLDREAGGGTLHGSGSYPLEYMQYVLDSDILEAKTTFKMQEQQTDTAFQMSLSFDKETLASIYMTTECELENQITFYGTKGKIVVPSYWKGQEAFITIDGKEEKIIETFESDFTPEVQSVINSIQNGELTNSIMTPEITFKTVSIVEKAYEEAYQN